MSKYDRPEWYAKAAADPFRKPMFTQKHKRQILDRIKQEENSSLKWTGRIVKFAAVTGITTVLIAIYLWGNLNENQWFSKNTAINPSEDIDIETGYPSDLSDWDEELVYRFLSEVDHFVRNIPIETTSKEQIITDYERYFSPHLSRAIFDSLYIESEGTWKIPDGDGGYMFAAPNKEQNEVSIFANEHMIIVEEKYESWMYSRNLYTITYDNQPIISEWMMFPDDHSWTQFDAANVRTGEEIGHMKAVHFDLQEAENQYLGTVQFHGTALLTGTLTYSNDETGDLLIFTPDSSSLTILPRVMHDIRDISLIFSNAEEAKALADIHTQTEYFNKTVIIEIDDYLINYQEKDVLNTAKLNQIFFQMSASSYEVNEQTIDQGMNDNQLGWVNKELGFALEGKTIEKGLPELTTVRWQSKENQSLSWNNSEIRKPIVYLHDLTHDQVNELIIMNILDHGSGLIVTEPHVLDAETLEEIPIEPLMDIITETVVFEYEDSKNSIVLNGEQIIYSEQSEGNKIKAQFDDWIHHTIMDSKLIGSVQVGDGTSSGIRGYLQVTYRYEAGQFVKDIVEFKKDFPTGAEPLPLTSTRVEGGL